MISRFAVLVLILDLKQYMITSGPARLTAWSCRAFRHVQDMLEFILDFVEASGISLFARRDEALRRHGQRQTPRGRAGIPTRWLGP